MTITDAYKVPINPLDLREMAQMLRIADVFTPTFRTLDVDPYDPVVYLQQKHRFKTKTQLLMDRNVLTRILALFRGMPAEPAHRLAAAVLAFAQCAGIEIEPNLALYEVAHRVGQETAVLELALFRQADNTHPGYWTDVALGRSDFLELPPESTPPRSRPSATNFAMPIRRWRRNYILCLKLAEIELQGGTAKEKLRIFLHWAYEEFLLGGPAIALAVHYFAPNAPRKGLMKGLQSDDRERALDGVRNAAWDLSILSEWLRYIEQQERDYRLVLLTTFDAWVHRIARAISDTTDPDEELDKPLRLALSRFWGSEAGSKVASEIEGYYGNREAPHRRLNNPSNLITIDTFISNGEAQIRAWKPSRTNRP